MMRPLEPIAPDPLLKLIGAFRSDPRPGKIDLGVGVFRDEDGLTPVLATVKEAERELEAQQGTKAYVGPEGDLEFVRLLGEATFGAQAAAFFGVQSVGGTGALRLGAELLRIGGVTEVLLPTPTWVNHAPVLRSCDLEILTTPFFDPQRQLILFEQIRDRIAALPASSAVLLQACCHNPLGADFTPDQWRALGQAIAASGATLFLDVAYQGFGDGVDLDMAGPLLALDLVPEALVAVSCSKSFGLYRERVGAFFIKCATEQRPALLSRLNGAARVSYSMPPDHGASVVRLILSDPIRKAAWREELEAMRRRITGVRTRLAHAGAGVPLLAAVGAQKGMFSTLALDASQVARLREDHAIYVTDSGRINVAGLLERDISGLVEGLAAVSGVARPLSAAAG